MSKRKNITAQVMEDLFVDAMGGDADAFAEYQRNARLLAKRSNQQFLQQERRDVTGEAYRRAQAFLGADEESPARFRENINKIPITDLRRQVDEMLAFSSARDYGITYAEKSKVETEKLYEPLRSAGVDTDNPTVMFWMNELFKTGAWKEYKKAYGRSTNLIQAAADQFAAGKTLDDLLDAYNDYASSRDGAPDLVQSFERFAPDSW